MTDTTTSQAPATQADLDAMTFDMYVDQGQNKAATARQMGISASTVADRVKRHSLRAAQDTLADSRALDAAQAEQDAEYAADSEAEQAPVTEVAPNVVVVRPDAIGEFVAQVNAEAAAALEAGQDTYQGTVCPEPKCNAVAFAFKGGHQPGCKYGTVASAAAHVEVDPDIAAILAAGQAGGVAAAAEQAGEVLAKVQAEHDHEADVPAEAPAADEAGKVRYCVKCGFDFKRPQKRQTCQSEKACQRRQADNAAAA